MQWHQCSTFHNLSTTEKNATVQNSLMKNGRKIAIFLDTAIENIKDNNECFLENKNVNLFPKDQISELLIIELKEHIITLKDIIKTQKEEISVLKIKLNELCNL